MINKIKTNNGIEQFVMPRTFYGEVSSISGSNTIYVDSTNVKDYTPVNGDQFVVHFNTTFSTTSSSLSLQINNSSTRPIYLNHLGMPGDFYWGQSGTTEITGTYLNAITYTVPITITTGSCILCVYKDNWYAYYNPPALPGKFFVKRYWFHNMKDLTSDNSAFNGENYIDSLYGLEPQQRIYGHIDVHIDGATCLGLVGWSSATRHITIYNYSLGTDSETGTEVLNMGISFMNYGTTTALGTTGDYAFYVAYLQQ